ncbi:MAG: spore germination protein [Clostridia bacterium]|nr:spore germination protein [Clostridia bacterium]
MTIIAGLCAGLGFFGLYALLKRFPNKNIMEINDIVLGKVFGRILSFVFASFLVFMAAMDMREFSEVLKVFAMPLSPPSFIMILFMLSVVFLCFMGLETLVRFSKFLIYVLGAGYLLVIIMSAQNYELSRIFPILGYGLDKTIVTGFTRSSVYGEIVLVGVFAASLHGSKEIRKIGLWGLIISGIVTSSALLAFSLAFQFEAGQEITAPMYAMARLINYGGLFERMEPVFAFTWNFISFITVGGLFFAALMIYCHIFRIPDKRPIIIPMATVIYSTSLLPSGLTVVVERYIQFIRGWGWFFFYLPAPIVLVIAAIRKKRGKIEEEKEQEGDVQNA